MQGTSIWDLPLPKAKSYFFSSRSVNYTWLESFVLSTVSLWLQQGISHVHVELFQAEISQEGSQMELAVAAR